MADRLHVDAEIEDIEYTPQICRDGFSVYTLRDLESGDVFSDSSFVVDCGGERYGFSHWVSPAVLRIFLCLKTLDFQYFP